MSLTSQCRVFAAMFVVSFLPLSAAAVADEHQSRDTYGTFAYGGALTGVAGLGLMLVNASRKCVVTASDHGASSHLCEPEKPFAGAGVVGAAMVLGGLLTSVTAFGFYFSMDPTDPIEEDGSTQLVIGFRSQR